MAFFENEPRLAVHLVSLFHPLPADFIARHADDLSWPGLALNERLKWSDDFVALHRARLDVQRLRLNRAIGSTPAMRALVGDVGALPEPGPPLPEATTVGDALFPWAVGCTLEPKRPLASLTLQEALDNEVHLSWARLVEAKASPWTATWARSLAPRFEAPHRNVSNVELPALRRVYDALCVPELGGAPLSFLEAFFAREPSYLVCTVEDSDVHGVLPTVQVDAEAFERDRVVAVNAYAQGPRRPVPIGAAQPLKRGAACVVIDRSWRPLFESCSLPPHSFHEVTLKPTKKLAGEPLVLRFEQVFEEGAVLEEAWDLLVATRAAEAPHFSRPQLLVSRRLAALLRARQAPHLTFSPGAALRLALARGVKVPAEPLVAATPAPTPVERSPAQAFFAAKRARLSASGPRLPPSPRASGALGTAEARLQRRFPEGFAAFLAKNGKKRVKGYRLLPPSRMYLLDRHGYELEHPESWGAVAIAENGVGDCVGLLLRKDSDHELGAVLHEFLHETGRVVRWSVKLG